MVPGKAVVLTARRGFAAFLGAGIVLALSGCATAPVAAPATAISPALLDGPQPPPATAVAPSASRQAAEDKALDRIFIDDTQMQQALDPLGTLERGQVPDLAQLRLVYTPALVAQERAANDHIRHRLDTIDRAALDDAHRISFDAFVQVNRGEQAMLAPDAQAMLAALPFNHFSGLPSEFPQLAAAESVQLNTADDFAQRLAVLETLPVLFGNATDRFREGMRSGVVQPRMTVANLEDRIAWFDDVLTEESLQGANADNVKVLQQERARLVSSLAQVRYAESLASDGS